MAIRSYKGITPTLEAGSYVDEQAAVIGDVVLGEQSSVWPMAVLRGDVNKIRIGRRSNIQDGTVCHVTHRHPANPEGNPLIIGDDVTIGHNVTLHGCTIGNGCLIGMGSTILDGAVLEEGVLLGAGSLVAPNKRLEGGYLWLGSPVKRVRVLTEKELAWFSYSAEHYRKLKEDYITEE